MTAKRFTFYTTSHFIRRCKERRLSQNEAEFAVDNPDRKIQQYSGKNNGIVFKYFKKYGSKTLIVVAETYKNECWLLTAYYDDSSI